MIKNSKKQIVFGSILDRLIDEAPYKKVESAQSHCQQLEALYKSVQRDLENLLNTRAPELTWPAQWNELNTSLLNYGIADVMSSAFVSESEKLKFCNDLAILIKRFETRFKSVQVKRLSGVNDIDRTLKIRIEGLLYVEPVPEPVMFDSVLEPETKQFLIADASFSH